MKRELSGGITSRKRFAGKSDFSAKQVSTTLLLLLLCMIMPQGAKAFPWYGDNGNIAYIDFTANSNYTLSSTVFKVISRQNLYMMTDSYYQGYIALQSSNWSQNSGLYQTNGGRYLSVQNVFAGDRFKVVWEKVGSSAGNVTFVDDGSEINPETEYTIQSDQGFVDIQVGRYVRVKQIIIIYNSSRVIWSGAQSGTKKLMV